MNGIKKCEINNSTDENANPTGGYARGIGIDINWQNGPLGRGDNRVTPNGAFVETVISAAKQRIEYYQDSKFNCTENVMAIVRLEEALMWLEKRTKDREDRGVEGIHKE